MTVAIAAPITPMWSWVINNKSNPIFNKEETQKFVEALNNNTLVMEQIKEVLTNGERK